MMDILREVIDKSNKAYPNADRVKCLGKQIARVGPVLGDLLPGRLKRGTGLGMWVA